MSTENIFLIVLLLVGLGYLLWVVFNMLKKSYCGKVKEHFTEEVSVDVKEEDTDSDEYKSRLNVMKVFETVLNRKPTSDEIEKYSKILNEQDILVEVLKDYPTSSDVTTPTPEIETEEEFISNSKNVIDQESITHSDIDKTNIIKKLDNITSAVESIKKMLG